MKERDDSKIDWFRVITDLERASYSHTSIASVCDVAKRTVGGWKQGSEPRYSDGDQLLLLWSAVTGKEREVVPMVGRFDWR